MKSSVKTAISVLLLALCAVIVVLGTVVFYDRRYYIVSIGVIILSLAAAFISFEHRPQTTRRLIILAVLVAVAVAGRAAFYMLPQFKPCAAVIIVAGAVFGMEAGFVTGALTGFLSNFIFGQGPWTPWQMFAFGAVGLLAGLIFDKMHVRPGRIQLAVFGFLSAAVVYGVIVDTYSVFSFVSDVSLTAVLSVYASGVVFNLIHGAATAFFLAVLGVPLIKKLDRLNMKYEI